MGMEIANQNHMDGININNKGEEEEEESIECSETELVSYIRQALKSVSDSGYENYTDHYSQLIGKFSNNQRLLPDEVAMLVTSLNALSKAVSYIDLEYHSSLLTSIFGMSLWNHGTDVMDALVELIKSLAVSNGKIVYHCLDMLVKNFMPPNSFLPLLSQPRGVARKEQVLDRVHSAIRDIADLVPLFPLLLSVIVPKSMPIYTSKEASSFGDIKIFLQRNEIYLENMLKLESGLLGKYVRQEMLSAVVFRLVELDVDIEWEELLQDDPSKGIFDMELEDIDEIEGHNENENDNDHPKAGFGLQKLGADVYAERLDKLMVLMCEHIKSCSDNGRLVEVFETLLQSFQKSVINTYKSKFVQFVIFYACSLDPENCGVKFLEMLVDTFMYASSPLSRMSAASYLASYLSRGRFLPSFLIASTLTRLIDWCAEYCKFQIIGEQRINPHIHRVYYSGCQAVMYVLCFRMRSMMEVPHLKSQLLSMPLELIFLNPLDPLKVCLPSIVTEFLRQAKAAQLFTVSEKNNFSDMLESDLSKTYGGVERYDSFFPFDPCLLKNCDRFIRPHFLYWSMIKTTYDDDGDDDNNSDGDIDENEGFMDRNGECFDDAMGRSFDENDPEFDLDEFENSMNKMSITPKSNLKHRSVGVQLPTRMPARIRPSTSPESL